MAIGDKVRKVLQDREARARRADLYHGLDDFCKAQVARVTRDLGLPKIRRERMRPADAQARADLDQSRHNLIKEGHIERRGNTAHAHGGGKAS